MSTSSPARPSIFISYSHKDKKYLDELKVFLDSIHWDWPLDVWDDNRIRVGDRFRAEIDSAMHAARAFIVLVSRDFLTSRFITSIELPAMLEREEKEGARIYPVIVGRCDYYETDLAPFQAANAPSEPLRALRPDKRDLKWEALARSIQTDLTLATRIDPRTAVEPDGDQPSQNLPTVSTPVPAQAVRVATTPLYTVDIAGNGPYHTISEAIHDAEPGSVIKVSQGTYHESLVIDKPLEIRGEGHVEILCQDADAVVFKSAFGVVSNLAVKHSGTEGCGLEIMMGHVEVVNCDISSMGTACVAIHGAATAILTGNDVHGGKVGVLVYDTAKGWLSDNDVIGNTQAGIEVKGSSFVTLLANRVSDNKQAGVLFEQEGSGALTDNDISGNTYSGVEIRGGNPLLRYNRIHDGLSGGVFIHGDGTAILEENDIFGNALAGVAVKDGRDPLLRGNRIRENHTHGVFVSEGGRGTFDRNEISKNWDVGVEIKGGHPVLTQNRIHDGNKAGVLIRGTASRGRLEMNDIYDNAHAGVAVQDGGDPLVHNNSIRENHTHGVFVSEGGRGTFDDNEISGNWDAGVEVVQRGDPVLRRNRIRNGTRDGVLITDGGRGTLEDNTIEDNSLSGIAVARDGTPSVLRNRLRNNDYGVYLGQGAAGVFEMNDLQGNRRKAKQDESGSDTQVQWDSTNQE